MRILPPEAPAVAYSEANDNLAGRSAEVRTRDGGLYHPYSVEITADSVLGWPLFGGAGNQFAIDEVVQIRTGKDRKKGGAVGGAIGAGVGLILGLVGYTESDYQFASRGEAAGGLAVGGALWGVLIGAIRGTRTQYRFGR